MAARERHVGRIVGRAGAALQLGDRRATGRGHLAHKGRTDALHVCSGWRRILRCPLDMIIRAVKKLISTSVFGCPCLYFLTCQANKHQGPHRDAACAPARSIRRPCALGPAVAPTRAAEEAAGRPGISESYTSGTRPYPQNPVLRVLRVPIHDPFLDQPAHPQDQPRRSWKSSSPCTTLHASWARRGPPGRYHERARVKGG